MKSRGVTTQESPYAFFLKNNLIREEKPIDLQKVNLLH